MNSLRMVLRFSFRPNKMGLCGRRDEGIYKLLQKGEWTPQETERVKDFVKDLEGLFTYLDAIAQASGLGPFDREVVEAYLFGWDRWGECDVGGHLKENLMPVAMESKKCDVAALPEGVPLTHCFHVLYFGGVAIEVPRIMGFADSCKVSLGTVEGGEVVYNRLLPGLELGEGRTELRSPLLEVGEGDRVFLHHGHVFSRTTKDLETAYSKDLRRVLEWAKGKKFNLPGL